MIEQRPSLMSVGEAAIALGVSEPTVWRWLRERRLASVRVGNSRRITRRSIELLIANRTVKKKRRRRVYTCPHCGKHLRV